MRARRERWARRWAALVAGAVAGGALPGCWGSAPDRPDLAVPTVEKATGQDTCRVAQDPLHPLVVEWPGTSKTQLDVLSQQGPVVVSYAGCVLKVLSGCQAAGSRGYEMVRVTPTREVVRMADESELRARLPLGVASLSGELSQGAGLELEYVSIGQRLLKEPPRTLSNDCAGATHYVQSITVGAYSLSSVASESARAGAAAVAADVGFAVTKKLARVRGSGDLAQCSAAPDQPDCQAVLQIGLSPLSFTGDRVASGGFGAGLGAVPVIPTMGEIKPLSGQGSLASVDVDLLQLLQAAKRADRDPQAELTTKAEAWRKLAAYTKSDNLYREAAQQRHEQWRSVIEAKARLAAQVDAMCDHRRKDIIKLTQLLSLDEDIVSSRQKAEYRRELEQVYSSWEPYFPRCRSRDAARGGTLEVPLPAGAGKGASSVPYDDRTEAERAADDQRKRRTETLQQRRSTLRTLGGTAYVFSGLTLAAGAGFGVAALLKKGDLDESCVDKRCPADSGGDLDGARTSARRSTVLLGVGAGLFVTGLTLRIIADGIKVNDRAAWSLHVSPLGLGLSGGF